jgi:hypothetical protein
MAKKTFKIGEYCKGGVITVEITGKKIAVIGKDWDTSAGWTKGSSQVNAKEWTRLEVQATENDVFWSLKGFLEDLTTSWWSDNIINWIESKVDLKPIWPC